MTFCAPLYRDTDEATSHIRHMGLTERLFALESPLARRACAWMCAFRALAQWVAVAHSPEWPVPLVPQGVLHTWPSYLGGMNGFILRAGWREALARLDTAGADVVLADGADDRVPVPGRSADLAAAFPHVRAVTHPKAGHDLTVSYPDWCAVLLDNAPGSSRQA